MPPIVDPVAIKFANERVRVFADAYGTVYHTAKALVQEWNAASMSARIPNTTDNIVDGSATDGRHPITSAQATAVITRAQELITDFEQASNAKLNTILNPAVNVQAKF